MAQNVRPAVGGSGVDHVRRRQDFSGAFSSAKSVQTAGTARQLLTYELAVDLHRSISPLHRFCGLLAAARWRLAFCSAADNFGSPH